LLCTTFPFLAQQNAGQAIWSITHMQETGQPGSDTALRSVVIASPSVIGLTHILAGCPAMPRRSMDSARVVPKPARLL